MGPQRGLGLGKKVVQSQWKPDSKTGQHSSHLRKTRAFLRHHQFNPRKEEFVVDSRASMHMLTRRYFSIWQKLETIRVSRKSMTVVTANGEVQANEEVTVNVKDLDLFVTVQPLEDTPPVLSRGQLCEDYRYSCEWSSGQKPHLIKKAAEYSAIPNTTCRSFSQDHQPVHPARLQLQGVAVNRIFLFRI